MSTLDNLNAAFDALLQARQADTGDAQCAETIADAAFRVFQAAQEVGDERERASWPPLPTLNPVPPVMSEQQLKEKLQ